jgi:hypothetical protein
MAWRSRHGAARRTRVGSGRVDEAVASTGHDTTSPHTVLGITSRLEGRLADRSLASLRGDVTEVRPAQRTPRSRVPTSPVRTHQARVRATRTQPVRPAPRA